MGYAKSVQTKYIMVSLQNKYKNMWPFKKKDIVSAVNRDAVISKEYADSFRIVEYVYRHKKVYNVEKWVNHYQGYEDLELCTQYETVDYNTIDEAKNFINKAIKSHLDSLLVSKKQVYP